MKYISPEFIFCIKVVVIAICIVGVMTQFSDTEQVQTKIYPVAGEEVYHERIPD